LDIDGLSLTHPLEAIKTFNEPEKPRLWCTRTSGHPNAFNQISARMTSYSETSKRHLKAAPFWNLQTFGSLLCELVLIISGITQLKGPAVSSSALGCLEMCLNRCYNGGVWVVAGAKE
jgi:hypothetical protein